MKINVSRGKTIQEESVFQLTNDTASYIGIDKTIPSEAVTCFELYVGPGYALATKEMVDAVKLVASTKAILLDPVYTVKTMAGLIDLIRKGFFSPNDNILLIHSGGTPAIYAYSPVFMNRNRARCNKYP